MKIRPQGGTRDKGFSPSLANVSQRDEVLIAILPVPEVGDESENLRGDPTDRGQRVPCGPKQAEDFQGVLFKNIELKQQRISDCPSSAHRVRQVHLILVQVDSTPTDPRSADGPPRHASPVRTYLLSTTPWSSFLVAHNRWDIAEHGLRWQSLLIEADIVERGIK